MSACAHASLFRSFWVWNSPTDLRTSASASAPLERHLREPRASERGGPLLAGLLLHGQGLFVPPASPLEIPLRPQSDRDLHQF
jgi:hypothetical protein